MFGGFNVCIYGSSSVSSSYVIVSVKRTSYDYAPSKPPWGSFTTTFCFLFLILEDNHSALAIAWVIISCIPLSHFLHTTQTVARAMAIHGSWSFCQSRC
jgi:hypothetical protein